MKNLYRSYAVRNLTRNLFNYFSIILIVVGIGYACFKYLLNSNNSINGFILFVFYVSVIGLIILLLFSREVLLTTIERYRIKIMEKKKEEVGSVLIKIQEKINFLNSSLAQERIDSSVLKKELCELLSYKETLMEELSRLDQLATMTAVKILRSMKPRTFR